MRRVCELRSFAQRRHQGRGRNRKESSQHRSGTLIWSTPWGPGLGIAGVLAIQGACAMAASSDGENRAESFAESDGNDLEARIRLEMVKVFHEIDRDRTGSIDAAHLRIALKDNQSFQKIIRDACIPPILCMDLLDKSKDGVVDLDEFLSLAEKVAEARDMSDKPPLKRIELAVNETFGTDLQIDKPITRNLIGALGIISVWSGLWNLMDDYLILPMLPGGHFRFVAENGLRVIMGFAFLYIPDGMFSINDIDAYAEEEAETTRKTLSMLEESLRLQIESKKRQTELAGAFGPAPTITQADQGLSAAEYRALDERLARIEVAIGSMAQKKQ